MIKELISLMHLWIKISKPKNPEVKLYEDPEE